MSTREQMYCTSPADKQLHLTMNYIFFSGVAVYGLCYVYCWQKAILSDILCVTPRLCIKYFYAVVIFILRNEKHVIILIAQINFARGVKNYFQIW